MQLLKKSSSATPPGSNDRLSKKEFARKLRHDAYQRAKEFRTTDPRQIAMMQKLKELRRDAYQKIKARKKAYLAELSQKDE